MTNQCRSSKGGLDAVGVRNKQALKRWQKLDEKDSCAVNGDESTFGGRYLYPPWRSYGDCEIQDSKLLEVPDDEIDGGLLRPQCLDPQLIREIGLTAPVYIASHLVVDRAIKAQSTRQ
jgi:hypothetical protein